VGFLTKEEKIIKSINEVQRRLMAKIPAKQYADYPDLSQLERDINSGRETKEINTKINKIFDLYNAKIKNMSRKDLDPVKWTPFELQIKKMAKDDFVRSAAYQRVILMNVFRLMREKSFFWRSKGSIARSESPGFSKKTESFEKKEIEKTSQKILEISVSLLNLGSQLGVYDSSVIWESKQNWTKLSSAIFKEKPVAMMLLTSQKAVDIYSQSIEMEYQCSSGMKCRVSTSGYLVTGGKIISTELFEEYQSDIIGKRVRFKRIDQYDIGVDVHDLDLYHIMVSEDQSLILDRQDRSLLLHFFGQCDRADSCGAVHGDITQGHIVQMRWLKGLMDICVNSEVKKAIIDGFLSFLLSGKELHASFAEQCAALLCTPLLIDCKDCLYRLSESQEKNTLSQFLLLWAEKYRYPKEDVALLEKCLLGDELVTLRDSFESFSVDSYSEDSQGGVPFVMGSQDDDFSEETNILTGVLLEAESDKSDDDPDFIPGVVNRLERFRMYGARRRQTEPSEKTISRVKSFECH